MTDLSGLGIPALEWGEVFHMGIRVADLAAAQQELTDALGVSWTKPATIPMKATNRASGMLMAVMRAARTWPRNAHKTRLTNTIPMRRFSSTVWVVMFTSLVRS